MNLQTVLVWTAATGLVVSGYLAFGWAGVALSLGGVLLWVLLHLTRMLQVLRKAADRPKGTVSSAVMLNAKLGKGLSMLQVVNLTKSLGTEVSAVDADLEEVWQWADNGGSFVVVHFKGGKVTSHHMTRPPADTAELAPVESGADSGAGSGAIAGVDAAAAGPHPASS